MTGAPDGKRLTRHGLHHSVAGPAIAPNARAFPAGSTPQWGPQWQLRQRCANLWELRIRWMAGATGDDGRTSQQDATYQKQAVDTDGFSCTYDHECRNNW